MKLLPLILILGSQLMATSYKKVTDTKLFNGETLSEYRLENGLRVLMLPRHQAKVLTYQIWFRVGSLHEKLDPKLKKTGLAHLFEHMMFRGTKKYPDGRFDELTARLGGDRQNATTHFYRTNYFESVPSRNLEKLMELESDRMANLNLNSELLEKEKGAVVGELRRHLDAPTSVAFDELFLQMYQTAPYRYTVLGSEAEIKGFTIEEGNYFYRTFYAPNNATLIIVGDTDEKNLMPLVEKYYGEMKAQPLPETKIPQEPAQKKERKKDLEHPQATSESLIMGYHVPSVNDPDVIPLSLLQAHLSRGMEASLRKLLVDTGIAVSASASVSSQPDFFEIFVQLADKKKASAAIKVVDQEMKKLGSKPIPKASFERALNQEKLLLYSEITGNSEFGNFLGEYLMLSGNYLRGFEVIQGYEKLQPKDLQRVAAKYLIPSNRSIVVIKPQQKTKEKTKGKS